jgi:hypothetical protein
MSRFYASIQGNRGEATRQGNKGSGIHSHTRGWSDGIRVVGLVNRDGKDEFRVWHTGGSNGRRPDVLIGRFSEDTEYATPEEYEAAVQAWEGDDLYIDRETTQVDRREHGVYVQAWVFVANHEMEEAQ